MKLENKLEGRVKFFIQDSIFERIKLENLSTIAKRSLFRTDQE